jgi:hypothetical protein
LVSNQIDMNAFIPCVVLLSALAAPLSTSAQAPAGPVGAFGGAVNGLQLRITPVTPDSGAPADVKFDVALQNTGDSNFVLNLGTMLGNGLEMWPDAIRLMLTDPAGQSRELHYRSATGVVAGRIDDYLVALRGHSVYTLRLSLADYTRGVDVKIAPGRYKIAAQLAGRRATGVNVDMQGVALLNFWSGVVHSNIAEFDVLK